MKIKILFLFVISFFLTANSHSKDFKFLADMDYFVDLIKFANYDRGTENDSLFRAWYFMEANTSLELDLFHYKDFSLYIQYVVNLGMGQTEGSVVFDPMHASFGINPWIEYRFGKNDYFIAQLGLDHYCFHEIDRSDFDVTLWNKSFLAIGSANKRNSKFKETVLRRKTLKWNGWGFDSWKFKDRFAWFVKFGYYAKSIFGMGEVYEVNYNNPLVFEADIDLRYAIAEYKKTVFSVFTKTKLGYYDYDWHEDPSNLLPEKTDGGFYYSSKIGAEILLLQGKHGFTLFCDYNFDDLPTYHKNYPRFSKNGLIEFGFRFYN